MASTLPAEKERAAAQDHPDSDEDLDDLDGKLCSKDVIKCYNSEWHNADVLDQFTHTSASQITRNESPAERATPSAPPPTATKSAFSRPRTNTRVDGPPLSIPGSGIIGGLDSAKEEDEDALSAEFTKNLAAGMETLMREIAGGMPAAGGSKESTGTGPESSERDKDAERAFKAAWEAMLVEGMDGMGADAALGTEFLGSKGGPASASAKTGVSSIGEKSDFQNKIRQAMDKLKEGESNLQVMLCHTISSQSSHYQADSTPRNIPGAGGLDDTQSIEALLAQLGELGLGEDGEGDDEELSGFLENMMDRLMSKDVLYEPLKELSENVGTLPPSMLERH